jgi:FkbM family methyltransferase
MRATTSILVGRVPQDRLTAVVDIGANPIDGDPPYKDFLDAGLCTVTGFEPQPEALERLLAAAGSRETYLPYAVGDGGEHTLRLTEASGMTSLLEPDPSRLALFNGFSGWGAVKGRVQVSTTRLDDVHEIEHLDLLKIDIQGGELMVFRGGSARLDAAVAVHTEVSFVPLYEEQPTFGDIDLELRGRGFVPHMLFAVKRWPIAPVIYGGDFRAGNNQLLEADVVYVRDFGRPDLMSDEQLTHLALIADGVYGSSDLAHLCLATLADRDRVDAAAPAEYLAAVP